MHVVQASLGHQLLPRGQACSFHLVLQLVGRAAAVLIVEGLHPRRGVFESMQNVRAERHGLDGDRVRPAPQDFRLPSRASYPSHVPALPLFNVRALTQSSPHVSRLGHTVSYVWRVQQV